MRKVFGIIFSILLLIMAVAGCSSKENKVLDTGKSLEDGLSIGKYVEENLVFPEGVAPSEFVSIAVSPDGEIELYAYNNNVYEKYLYADKKWRKTEAEKLQKFNSFTESNFILRKVFYGEDKKQYLLGDTPLEYHNSLYRLSDSGVYEKVELKRFEDTYEEWDNVFYRPKESRYWKMV